MVHGGNTEYKSKEAFLGCRHLYTDYFLSLPWIFVTLTAFKSRGGKKQREQVRSLLSTFFLAARQYFLITVGIVQQMKKKDMNNF